MHLARSPYNYDMAAESARSAADSDPLVVTVQASKDESDINVLVRRFGVTGQINGIQRPPPIQEFGDIFDFQSAMNLVRQAEESFYQMPAEVKDRFHYSTAEFVDFCSNPDNIAEMRKFGLALPEVKPPEPPPPMKVEVVNPPK